MKFSQAITKTFKPLNSVLNWKPILGVGIRSRSVLRLEAEYGLEESWWRRGQKYHPLFLSNFIFFWFIQIGSDFKLIIKTFIMYTNIPDSLLGPCIGEWSLWKTDGENLWSVEDPLSYRVVSRKQQSECEAGGRAADGWPILLHGGGRSLRDQLGGHKSSGRARTEHQEIDSQ